MGRISLIFLVLCLIANFLPACNDAVAKSNYKLGASCRRCSFEDPMAHWYEFEPDDADDDYLGCANPDLLEATSFTVVGKVRREDKNDNNSAIMSLYTDGTDQSWMLYSIAVDTYAKAARNACNGVDQINTNALGVASGEDILVAMTFEYSGNAGVNDSTLKVYVRDPHGWSINTLATARGPVIDCTGLFRVASWELGVAAYSFDGRHYWDAYYASVMVQADLQDMYDGTSHPATDYDPLFYIDYSKAVAATYVPEVGEGIVLDVFGSPVQGP